MTGTSTAKSHWSRSLAVVRAKERRALASKQNVPAHQEADGTQSIHRALRVLRLLANSAASGMRLVDIARGARLHHSTTHRILRALEQEGIVERLINVCRQNISDIWFGDKRVCGSSGLEVQAAIAC
jgi:hypothetical protein